MAYYKASDLPFYHALASAFTVCDAYHCSTLTQTYPNRLHLWTGCNGGGKVGGDPEMSNYGEDETPSADMAEDQPMATGPHDWTTYAERLQAAGVSWKVYQEHDNFGDNILSVFKPFRPCPKDSPLYQRGRAWVSEHKTGADRTRSDGEQLVEAFRADIAGGRLPQVSWIVTAADLSEHPSAEPSKGEHVCAKLIEALVDHPEVFSKTVFIVNYDEAGGFYDHMQPPMPPLTPDQGHSTVSVAGEAKLYGADADPAYRGAHPLGLGIRVPAIVVSPWSRGGFVCSEVFDHTSTLQFLEKRFGVREQNISDWRRTVCGDLTSAFDFKRPNQDWAACPCLPRPITCSAWPARRPRPACAFLNARFPPSRRDRSGTPGPCPIPGRPGAGRRRGRLDRSGQSRPCGRCLSGVRQYGPRRAVALHARPRRDLCGGSLERRRTGLYDLTVHGPNGFYRRFAGDASRPQPQVTIAADARGLLTVGLTGAVDGSTLAILDMDPAYPLSEGEARRRLTLRPGAETREVWDLRGSDHWYDLTVSLTDDPGFIQRMAGHVETAGPAAPIPPSGVCACDRSNPKRPSRRILDDFSRGCRRLFHRTVGPLHPTGRAALRRGCHAVGTCGADGASCAGRRRAGRPDRGGPAARCRPYDAEGGRGCGRPRHRHPPRTHQRGYLGRAFGPDVTEPVRLHVAAKRCLATTAPGYVDRLSAASLQSLALQGGPMTPAEVEEFMALPAAEAALRLRRYDELGKAQGVEVAGFETYRELLCDLINRRADVSFSFQRMGLLNE